MGNWARGVVNIPMEEVIELIKRHCPAIDKVDSYGGWSISPPRTNEDGELEFDYVVNDYCDPYDEAEPPYWLKRDKGTYDIPRNPDPYDGASVDKVYELFDDKTGEKIRVSFDPDGLDIPTISYLDRGSDVSTTIYVPPVLFKPLADVLQDFAKNPFFKPGS